jgi:hypothetical protein
MKAISYLAAALLCSSVLWAGEVNAQNVGVAADKQKQENLEKNKKRQAEMKKKYDAMTPEQKAEAKRKADAYKKSGGKTTAPAVKKPGTTAVSKTTQTPKQGTVKQTGKKGQPVWLDEKGNPKKTTPPQAGKKDVKPGATPATKATPPVKKPVIKPAGKTESKKK